MNQRKINHEYLSFEDLIKRKRYPSRKTKIGLLGQELIKAVCRNNAFWLVNYLDNFMKNIEKRERNRNEKQNIRVNL